MTKYRFKQLIMLNFSHQSR